MNSDAERPIYETTVPPNAYQEMPVELVAISDAIMPVIGWADGAVEWLGTCFAVSPDGLVMTAKHVISEFMDTHSEPIRDGTAGIMVVWETDHPLPPDAEGIPQTVGGFLNCPKAYLHPTADIALFRVTLPHLASPLGLSPLQINVTPPLVGDQCLAIGYKHCLTRGEILPGQLSNVEYERQLVVSRGTVTEVHHVAHDSVKWPVPCFVTDASYNGGMSGSPVLLSDGTVHGMVCSSDFTGRTPHRGASTSHVSMLADALTIHLEGGQGIEDLFLNVAVAIAGDDIGFDSFDIVDVQIEPTRSLDDVLLNRFHDETPAIAPRIRYRVPPVT